jgi:hypothetical protein
MEPTKSTLTGTEGGPWCSPRRSGSAPISSQLIDPGGQLVAVEAQVLPELHVRNGVCARALIEPANRHS